MHLIDSATEFPVLTTNYGCHILKFSMANEDTPPSASVSQSPSFLFFPAYFFNVQLEVNARKGRKFQGN